LLAGSEFVTALEISLQPAIGHHQPLPLPDVAAVSRDAVANSQNHTDLLRRHY
jgi:hypothetical protein